MQHIVPGALTEVPLHNIAATRRMEANAAATLPEHTLMARAGAAVASLTRALAPHARRIWIACGPGNNGGDGFVAAGLLRQTLGPDVDISVTFHGSEDRLPSDARWALQGMREAGLEPSAAPPDHWDLAVDALLGIGADRIPEGELGIAWQKLRTSAAPVLHVDIPSGLLADTGDWPAGEVPSAPSGAERHTLSLLALKPGLFTARGRDVAGDIWFDDLGASIASGQEVPTAILQGGHPPSAHRPHDSHKGSFGNVMVIGGQGAGHGTPGMSGAALLAGRAALHAGAGRVYLGMLESAGTPHITLDPICPELMFRTPALVLEDELLNRVDTCLVCGCGGGTAVADVLPEALSRARVAVFDADALNVLAKDAQLMSLLQRRRARGWTTVLTPHPLEASRLLGVDTRSIQSDRLQAAQSLADRTQAIVVLKGSGTVVAAPGETPSINFSGNGQLATAGTGDVLAGMIGAALAAAAGQAAQTPTLDVVRQAVWRHGHLADQWKDAINGRLTASVLAYQ